MRYMRIDDDCVMHLIAASQTQRERIAGQFAEQLSRKTSSVAYRTQEQQTHFFAQRASFQKNEYYGQPVRVSLSGRMKPLQKE